MQQEDLELGLDAQRVLNSTIRPLLNIDAGDAEVTEVSGGHVRITLLGSCGRCAFRLSCAAYTVVDRLEEALGDRGATFEVTGVPSAATLPRIGARAPAAGPRDARTRGAGAPSVSA